jgi:endonuclease YncB( thermonuclease family)
MASALSPDVPVAKTFSVLRPRVESAYLVGKAAKRYVQALIDAAEEIIVVTSKVDKYDRYLADVYLRQRNGGKISLNNPLLENGHAVRMNPSAQENWIP